MRNLSLAEVTPGRPSSLHPQGRLRRVAGRVLQIALPVVLLAAAVITLAHELRDLSWLEVRQTLTSLPRSRVALAVAATAGGYLVLTLYDLMALSYLGKPRSWLRLLPLSFVSFAFANNVGFAVLSGGSVRFRLFPSLGVGARDIARIIAFTSFTTFLGQLELGGIAALRDPQTTAQLLHLPVQLVWDLALVLVAIGPAYLIFVRVRPQGLRFRGFHLPAPRLGMATAQLVVACGDWVLNAFVLWALLPVGSHVSYDGILALFLAAQLVGSLSQVPGGLGVFDSLVIAALTPSVPVAAVISTLVVYRLIYFVGPFLLAAALLALNEARERREALGRLARSARSTVGPIVPLVASAGAFLAGAVMLLSDATPELAFRLVHIEKVTPLGVLEISHLLGSIVGVGLLLLARGLSRRLDAAFVLAEVMLGVGVLVSLARGLMISQAAILLLVLLALLPFHREFYRPASLLSERFTPPWVMAIALVLGGAGWIGWFSHTHGEFRSEQFWRFALDADQPRALRALLAGTATAVLFGVAQLLRPPQSEPALPGEAELDVVRPLSKAWPERLSHLALSGDEALLLHESGQAFLAYGVEGRMFVALGDPVGPPELAQELAWRLSALADRHRGVLCFYDVGEHNLPLYAELGLASLDLGSEAMVNLAGFSLDAPGRADLQDAVRRVSATHHTEITSSIEPFMPVLRTIDAAFLAAGGTEKSFDAGRLDGRYLAEGLLLLVWRKETPVAFASLWQSGGTASVDVVRHLPGEEEALDLLLVRAMEWARSSGAQRFSLGLSPLPELEFRRPDAWELRRYKERFAPTWIPRHFAGPPGLSLPSVLASVARLIRT